MILKGFSNGRFYPPPYRRWMRDIDLFTPSWRDALALVEELLHLGYEFDRHESPWVKADAAAHREEYGQVFLVRDEGADIARVDVHFGTYSVGYAGYLTTRLADLATTTEVASGHVSVLKPEGCIVLAQAHALSDGYIAVKDVNDFVAAASSGEEIDWDRVGLELRRHALQPQAALLAHHCLRLFDDKRVIEAAASLLSAVGAPRHTIWRAHDRSWRRRAAVNASFAYRWARKVRRHSFVAASVDAVRCYLFYVRRLHLEVRRRTTAEKALHWLMAKPRLAAWQLRPDACTLLIDAGVVASLSPHRTPEVAQSRPVDAGIEYIATHRHEFVRLSGRLYVPTVDLLIDPEHAAAVPDV
jgi:hypothetical protein